MSSIEDGVATARLELLSGYPGYFYAAADGDFTYAMDRKYGLPIRLFGDAGPDIEWMNGFNAAVNEYCAQNGPPWNSRRAWLNLITDPKAQFNERASKAFSLRLDSEPFTPEGLGCSLILLQAPTGLSIRLESQNLFRDPGIVPHSRRAYRHGPPPQSIVTTQKAPAVGPGAESVWLQWFDDARSIECVSGPVGSHLIVFRFSEFASAFGSVRHRLRAKFFGRSRNEQRGEEFGVLDAQLAEWIPGVWRMCSDSVLEYFSVNASSVHRPAESCDYYEYDLFRE